jgi:hypothetical protein
MLSRKKTQYIEDLGLIHTLWCSPGLFCPSQTLFLSSQIAGMTATGALSVEFSHLGSRKRYLEEVVGSLFIAPNEKGLGSLLSP